MYTVGNYYFTDYSLQIYIGNAQNVSHCAQMVCNYPKESFHGFIFPNTSSNVSINLREKCYGMKTSSANLRNMNDSDWIFYTFLMVPDDDKNINSVKSEDNHVEQQSDHTMMYIVYIIIIGLLLIICTVCTGHLYIKWYQKYVEQTPQNSDLNTNLTDNNNMNHNELPNTSNTKISYDDDIGDTKDNELSNSEKNRRMQYKEEQLTLSESEEQYVSYDDDVDHNNDEELYIHVLNIDTIMKQQKQQELHTLYKQGISQFMRECDSLGLSDFVIDQLLKKFDHLKVK